MIDIPPTEYLTAYLAAHRTGSLSAAAAELGLTHGAVSRRIAAVEAWIGQPLFERHGRGVRPTATGTALAKRIERSLNAIGEFAAGARSTGRNVVRISVLPSFARLWLAPRMARLEGTPGDAVIQPITEHRVATLLERECDLAVRCGFGDWPGVAAEQLFGDALQAFAHPRIAATIGSDPQAILKHPLLHDTDSGDWRRWLAAVGLTLKPRPIDRRFEDYDLLLSAAADGMGVALARMPFAAEVLEGMPLVPLSGPTVPIGRGQWLVWRPGEQRVPVLAVRDRIVEHARATRESWQARVPEPAEGPMPQ